MDLREGEGGGNGEVYDTDTMKRHRALGQICSF
jgi:hypothetical protein